MAGTTIDAVQRTVQKSNEWLHDLAAELGVDERTGFDPRRQPKRIRDREVFVERLRERARLADAEEAANVAAAATRVMRRHITEGEFEDALAQLPAEIRGVLVPGSQ